MFNGLHNVAAVPLCIRQPGPGSGQTRAPAAKSSRRLGRHAWWRRRSGVVWPGPPGPGPAIWRPGWPARRRAGAVMTPPVTVTVTVARRLPVRARVTGSPLAGQWRHGASDDSGSESRAESAAAGESDGSVCLYWQVVAAGPGRAVTLLRPSESQRRPAAALRGSTFTGKFKFRLSDSVRVPGRVGRAGRSSSSSASHSESGYP